jgi:HxlR-like helix-turn-helix
VLARTDYKEVPPRVDYALTPLGRSVADAIVPLCTWGTENMAEMTSIFAKRDTFPSPRVTSVEERQAVLTVAHAWRTFRVFRLCVRRKSGWYPLGSAEDCQGARPAVSRIRKTSTRAAARS